MIRGTIYANPLYKVVETNRGLGGTKNKKKNYVRLLNQRAQRKTTRNVNIDIIKSDDKPGIRLNLPKKVYYRVLGSRHARLAIFVKKRERENETIRRGTLNGKHQAS